MHAQELAIHDLLLLVEAELVAKPSGNMGNSKGTTLAAFSAIFQMFGVRIGPFFFEI